MMHVDAFLPDCLSARRPIELSHQRRSHSTSTLPCQSLKAASPSAQYVVATPARGDVRRPVVGVVPVSAASSLPRGAAADLTSSG